MNQPFPCRFILALVVVWAICAPRMMHAQQTNADSVDVTEDVKLPAVEKDVADQRDLPRVEKDLRGASIAPGERPQEVFATFLRPQSVKRIILLEDDGLGRHAGFDPDGLFARLIKSSEPGADFGIDAWETPVARFLILMKTDEVFEVTVLSQVVRQEPAVTGVLLFGKGFARRFDFRAAPLTAAKESAGANEAPHQGDQLLHWIPKLDDEWELLVDEPKPQGGKDSRFQWAVFRNKKSGDYLSFATHPELGKGRSVEFLSDTSLEIFPEGLAVWTHPARNTTRDVVSIDVVDAGRTAPLKGQKLLRYCFISKSPGRDNLMAHGRTWSGPAGVLFVQHTSARPITSEFVHDVALSMISRMAAKTDRDTTSNAQVAGGPAAVSVTVAGVEVRASVTDNGRTLTLSVDGKQGVRVDLPASEIVSEIRISRWMLAGIALAIETRNAETKEISYFWTTAWMNDDKSQLSRPGASRFLTTKVDYDVAGIVNSQSDSICITLLRHRRGNDSSQSFDGFIYVNNCPVGPGIKGLLFPVAVDSTAAEHER